MIKLCPKWLAVIAIQLLSSQTLHAKNGNLVYAKQQSQLEQQYKTSISNARQLCDTAIKTGNYSKALKTCLTQLDRLKKFEAKQLQPSTDTLFIYLSLVDIYHALGDNAQETTYLLKIEQHPLFKKTPAVAYRWRRKMGQKYYFTKDYEKAAKHLYQGLSIAQQQVETRLKDLQNHDDELPTEDKDTQAMLAKSFNDVGLVEAQLGNFKQALEHYQKSLAIKFKLGDRYRVGTTLNNIGLIYAKLEKPEQSIDYYEQALNEFLKYTKEPDFDRRVFNNINHVYEDLAVTYEQLDDQKKKTLYQHKATQSIQNKASEREKARALINIGQLQIEAEQFDSAKQFLQRATDLQENAVFDLRLELNLQWAQYYLQIETFPKAISYANSGVVIAEEKNDLLSLEKLYLILSQSYLSSEVKTAYFYLEKHAKTREAFLAQKYDAELQSVQLEIDKQQIEHQLMREKITNTENQAEIQRLTNWVLTTIILVLLFASFIIFFWFKKRKEKQSLMQSIKYHQQQLLVLNDKYEVLSKEKSKAADDISTDNKLKISSSIDTESEQSLQINELKTIQARVNVQKVNHPAHQEVKKDAEQCIKQQLRQTLVNTMLNAVTIWESYTATNRVELAEKSKIWTVSIDNGTLRTRSLDKYLHVDKIPRNPRWRNVAGTCHFILADPALPAPQRKKLNQNLDAMMQVVKALSLTASVSD